MPLEWGSRSPTAEKEAPGQSSLHILPKRTLKTGWFLGFPNGRSGITFAGMDEPIIDLQSDQYFMGEALRQALKAYAAEEVPIGAVVVREGRVIARAFNQVELLKDATAHAEMLAITQAEGAVGDWRLTDCTLYITKEPCPMCAGAIVHVRFPRVVFGASDPKSGAAGSVLNLLEMAQLNHRSQVTRGVREEECRQLLQTFFAEQRQRSASARSRKKSDTNVN